MGIENNRDVEKIQEQNVEKNENKPENQEQINNKLNNIKNDLAPPNSKESKENKEDNNYKENKTNEPKESKEELEKRLEQVQERKSSEDYDRMLPSEKKANDKEENELKEKLKSYEKSEEQQDGENKTNDPKESKEELEKRLEQVQERKSSEDYDRMLPSEKKANDKEENELKEKLKSYEKSEEQQDGENKTNEPKESKEELEKRLEQVQERKSSEDYDRMLPSEKEANNKEENELKEKLKSYEKPEEQQDGENKTNEPKESKEELEKRLEQVQERKSSEDYDRMLPSEKEANDKEENELKEKLKSYEKPQTIEEKLNELENSLQPKGVDGNEFDIEEKNTNDKETSNEREKQIEGEVSEEEESDNKTQVENVEYGNIDRYDDITSLDDNNELSKVLESFEQSKWDSMDMDERKIAISELRDSIASELDIQNKPNIEYYGNYDEGDFGGYSPSENTIYINEYNMDDATETADTIAHESRHCWQYERAENPENDQDKEFKENLDDYIYPADDYRGYKNQPVEVDAREYASDIVVNIPEKADFIESDSNRVETSNTSRQDIQKLIEEKGAVFDKSSETPEDLNKKTAEFESKIKSLEQYDSDLDYYNQQKLEDYYKNNDGKLSDNQKINMVSELKTVYDKAANSERGDILVPENAKYVSSIYYNNKSERYDIGYDWKPVDTKPETRKMENMMAGQQFDRVGPPTGRCIGAVDENGNCATLEQRSIPYHFTEGNITEEPSYHRYEVEQDFTRENLNNAIDNSYYSEDKKEEMKVAVEKYYENSAAKGYGSMNRDELDKMSDEEFSNYSKSLDGLATGEIAPMFEGTGGGKQYDMPLSMEELENIGMISEVPKNKY